MKKSELSRDSRVCFLDDVEIRYGTEVRNYCANEFDRLSEDDEFHSVRMLNEALRNLEVKVTTEDLRTNS